jgi:hypothetical protein
MNGGDMNRVRYPIEDFVVGLSLSQRSAEKRPSAFALSFSLLASSFSSRGGASAAEGG